MRISPSTILAAAVSLAVALPAVAQTPPAPAANPKNLLRNAGFETGFRLDNIWDGVDSLGFLAGNRADLPVLTTSGAIQDTPMPVSVSVADLNGDKLLDLGVMDVMGYLRVFFNSGTATEPKFTLGELSTVYLSRTDTAHPSMASLVFNSGVEWQRRRFVQRARWGQRITLADMSRNGKSDLILGNYHGEIMMIPNSGTPLKPDFRQPADIGQAIIPTSKDPSSKWGSLLSPVVWDWNNDGRGDLLVGEGSYSANSIHLLLNQGSGARPAFNEDQRNVIAYGMGLEQLTPTVVDYNGDGRQDLLVTERSGKVAIYLNTDKPWKPGETLPFHTFVRLGSAPASAVAPGTVDPMDAAKSPGLLSLGGIATISAADLNGDGLFDLVFGKTNGKVALALNSGTKTEPKFATPVEIKGDAGTPAFMPPSGWDYDFGLARGNFYGFFSIVTAENDAEALPTEGKAALKAGYSPSPNKFLPVPNQYNKGLQNFKIENAMTYMEAFEGAPANTFILTQQVKMQPGKPYTFTMKYKGARVISAVIRFGLRGDIVFNTRVTRGDRGAVQRDEDKVHFSERELVSFSPGPQWQELRRDITLRAADARAQKALEQDTLPEGSWFGTYVSVIFDLAPGQGVLYLDDFVLVPKE
jgi:hypothetical protein